MPKARQIRTPRTHRSHRLKETDNGPLFKRVFLSSFTNGFDWNSCCRIFFDYRARAPEGIFVKRGPESMSTLQKAAGLVIAAIVTIINKSVFDDNSAPWRQYSAIINTIDLGAIIYLFYLSPWS